jgi:hypothetical protein
MNLPRHCFAKFLLYRETWIPGVHGQRALSSSARCPGSVGFRVVYRTCGFQPHGLTLGRRPALDWNSTVPLAQPTVQADGRRSVYLAFGHASKRRYLFLATALSNRSPKTAETR